MLEAKDIDNIDEVSRFLGAIVDANCGNKNAVVNRTYTFYVDMRAAKGSYEN